MALRLVGFLLSINEGETEWSSQVLYRGRRFRVSMQLIYCCLTVVCLFVIVFFNAVHCGSVHIGENEILFLSKLFKSK